MKFLLVDRIESLELGERDGCPCGRIVTTKALSLAEEYLADHFPAFPVLPGVLMLESMTQSAAWLVRVQQDFARSIIVLAAAKNVRYGNFVAPGNILRSEVEVTSIKPDSAKCKAIGFVGDQQAVSARLQLRCFNLAESRPSMAQADKDIVTRLRQQFKLIGGPQALAAGE